jgi:hypothetical protein
MADRVEDGDRWHGWQIGKAALHVGRHPYRKSVALMASVPDYGLTALAYFRTEADADLALALLDGLVNRTGADGFVADWVERQKGEV